MSKLSKATIVPALWLLSFLGSFFLLPMSDVLQTSMVVTLLTAIFGYTVCMAGHNGSTTQIFKYNPLTILMMLLWAVVGVSVINSATQFESLTYFFFFSAFPLTFLLFSFVDATNLFKPIRIMLFGFGIISLVQFYFYPDTLKFEGTHWPLADNNSLAALLACGSLMFVAESLKGGKSLYYNLAAAIILFAALMTTGGVAVFFGFFLVFAVFVAMAKPVSYKPAALFMAGVIVLLFAMVTSDLSIYHFFGTGTETIHNFLEKDIGEPNRLSGSRMMMWQSTYEIFKNHFWTGTGIGTFFLNYPEFRSINDNSAGYMAHNDFIQLASETGVFGPLMALSIIGYLLFKTVTLFKQQETANDRIQFLMPFAVFGLIIGHSLVNFNMYVLPTLMLMGILLAHWNSKTPMRTMNIGGTKTIHETVCFMVAMAILVPLWGCSLSEHYTTQATEKLARQDIQGFAQSLNLADKWAAGQNGRATLQAAKFSAATNNEEKASELLDRAQLLNPQLTQIYVERAYLLMETDTNAALAEAQKALKMDEGAILARMMLSDILSKMGKDDDAYNVLKAGLNGAMRTRNPREFYQKLSEISLSRMDFETHKTVLLKLKKLQR